MGNKSKKSKLIIPANMIKHREKLAVERVQNQLDMVTGKKMDVVLISDMNTTKRPLSPHLQIYKPQLTSVLSITHRLTGFCIKYTDSCISWILYFLTLSQDSHSIVMSFFFRIVL